MIENSTTFRLFFVFSSIRNTYKLMKAKTKRKQYKYYICISMIYVYYLT